MLDRQGIVMNQKKLRRLYREEKLQVRRRGSRKRALGTRRLMLESDRANARWSLDFVSDGRRFGVLAVVDDYKREWLVLVGDTSLSGLRVVRELDANIVQLGFCFRPHPGRTPPYCFCPKPAPTVWRHGSSAFTISAIAAMIMTEMSAECMPFQDQDRCRKLSGMRYLACTTILSTVLAMAGPADADESLFKAMSMMAMGTGMPDVLPPTIEDGNYVDIRFSGITASGDVLSPGPSECSVIHTVIRQDRGEFVQASVTTYNFSRITGVRYLGAKDDFLKASSREPDDPEVDTISLDGETWQCQRVIHVDPVKPGFTQYCDNSWQIALVGDDDKRAAREAIELIRKSCFAP